MENTVCSVGYQFVPTDEELITNYLSAKIKNQPLPYNGISKCDLYGNKSPWEIFDEKQTHYVFTKLKNVGKKLGKKRVARGAGVGTWHGNNKGGKIRDVKKNVIGIKKTFTFKVKPDKNKNLSKTEGNWIMHEFSLPAGENCSDYVICRVHKNIKKGNKQDGEEEEQVEDCGDNDLAAYIESFIDENEALNTCVETPVNESQAPSTSAVASYDAYVVSANQSDEGLHTTDMTSAVASFDDYVVLENQSDEGLYATDITSSSYIETFIDDSEELNTCAAATSINESQAPSTSAVASYVSANPFNDGLYTTDMTISSTTDVGDYGMGNSSEYFDFDSLYEYLLLGDELPNLQEDEVSMQELTDFADSLMDIPYQHVQEIDVFLPTPMCS